MSSKPPHTVLDSDTSPTGSVDEANACRQRANWLEESPDGFVEMDRDCRLTYMNHQAEIIFGYSRASRLGHPLQEMDLDETFAPLLRTIETVAGTGVSAHFEHCNEAKDTWFQIRAYRTESGLAVFFRDVTTQRRLERNLREETERRREIEARFEAALSVNPLVVFNLDRALRYTWVYNNQINARDFDGLDKTPADFFDEETAPSLLDFFRSVIERGVSRREELRLRPKASAEDRYFITSAKPVLTEDGQVVGLTGASIDITMVVRQREELAAAKEEAMQAKTEAERASAAKSKFLAAASHDLRQPVQSLMLLNSVLKRRLTGTPADTVVDCMDQALEALRVLLDSLLDISKLDAGVIIPDRETLNIGELLARLTGEYQIRAIAAKVSLHYVPTTLRTYTDAALLERVLRNLIENAFRYTPIGHVLVGCRRRGETVRIDVLDTGIGIAAENIDVIFEEFYQIDNEARNRAQGLGLGLAIVRRIIRLLDATIEVQSVLSHGSRFSITLPMVAHAGAEKKSADLLRENGGKRILIIEDDPILRNSFKMTLADWGHIPETVSTGEHALDLVATGYRPDAIVADYRLNRGMTGIETITRIRETLGAAIPSLLVTGDTIPDIIPVIACQVLHKPVATEDLFRILFSMLV